MDLTTLVGLVAGIACILLGMTLKGADPSALMSPEALLIIFGGTAAAVTIAFPGSVIKRVPKLFKTLFTNKKSALSNQQLVEMMVQWTNESRKNGILSLESKINSVDDEFLKRVMKLVIDGMSAEQIGELVETEIEALEERHAKGALIFTQAGTYAPTLGVLGAVIGLVAALGNLKDVGKLGESISSAFIATLFGIFTGYVLWHPFSNKLKQKSQEEVFRMNLILEAALLIQAGTIASLLEKRMLSMLSPSERNKYLDSKKKGRDTNVEKEA